MEENAIASNIVEEQTAKLLNKTFILGMVLVIGVLVFFAGQLFYQSKQVNLQNQNQITVSGQGKVYAKPDVAIINLGVESKGSTVAGVTSSNTKEMNAIIKAVKDLKIDDKDIQTTNYNLSPSYNWTEAGGRVFEGYSLSQNVQIKIRDFTKIGDVLTAGTDNGANLVGDLQFTIDNPEAIKEKARAKAIAQAKTNAKNLAKDSGIKLDQLINVYESGGYYPVMYSAAEKSSGYGGGSNAPIIQPGQQEITVTINLTYKID